MLSLLKKLQLQSSTPAGWGCPRLAGRLTELSGSGSTAVLTVAFGLVAEAQLQGEPVAWIAVGENIFFPPDAATGGVDLDALAVVRVATAQVAAQSADRLVRSGAFGLVVLDLGEGASIPMPLLSRLTKLAQEHHTVVLCLTTKGSRSGSLGSLISVRGQVSRRRLGADHFQSWIQGIKDKQQGPGWHHVENCRGAPGLR